MSVWAVNWKIILPDSTHCLSKFFGNMILYRYSSCSFPQTPCWGDLFKNPKSRHFTSRIRMKFGKLFFNTHRSHALHQSWMSSVVIRRSISVPDLKITVQYFFKHRLRQRHTFKMAPWPYITQKSAAIWWVHTQRLPGAYAVASASFWSILHSKMSQLFAYLAFSWQVITYLTGANEKKYLSALF